MGYDLSERLHNAGANPILCSNSNKAVPEKPANEPGAKVVGFEDICESGCDIFSLDIPEGVIAQRSAEEGG